jgi:3-isopropylmalate/(R)-2-methylmalate dehydratase small subunit
VEDAKRERVEGGAVSLPGDDVDTDRIIPARFLKEITFEELGRHAFADERFDARGAPRPHPLNDPRAAGAAILVVGRNFGCGSSREHAPWALLDYGFRAVLSSEIADIFRSNALRNGLLAVVLSEAEHKYLLKHPGIELAIDVAAGTIELPDGGRFRFEIDEFARHCLLQGVDQLGFLQQHSAQIDAFEASREARR